MSSSSYISPSCVPETRVDKNGLTRSGACANPITGGPGYRNLAGWPPCCDTPDGRMWAPGGPIPMGENSSMVTKSENDVDLSNAASGCVAKNPNYPSVAGSCVYNPNNPCPGNFETVDTRFGTKMCCAPRTSDNEACFVKPRSSVSRFGKSKSTFGSKSNFGSSLNIIIVLAVLALLFFIIKKKKLFR